MDNVIHPSVNVENKPSSRSPARDPPFRPEEDCERLRTAGFIGLPLRKFSHRTAPDHRAPTARCLAGRRRRDVEQACLRILDIESFVDNRLKTTTIGRAIDLIEEARRSWLMIPPGSCG